MHRQLAASELAEGDHGPPGVGIRRVRVGRPFASRGAGRPRDGVVGDEREPIVQQVEAPAVQPLGEHLELLDDLHAAERVEAGIEVPVGVDHGAERLPPPRRGTTPVPARPGRGSRAARGTRPAGRRRGRPRRARSGAGPAARRLRAASGTAPPALPRATPPARTGAGPDRARRAASRRTGWPRAGWPAGCGPTPGPAPVRRRAREWCRAPPAGSRPPRRPAVRDPPRRSSRPRGGGTCRGRRGRRRSGCRGRGPRRRRARVPGGVRGPRSASRGHRIRGAAPAPAGRGPCPRGCASAVPRPPAGRARCCAGRCRRRTGRAARRDR